MVLVYHMISQSHVSNRSCDYGEEILIVSNHLAKRSDHSHCGNEDMMVLDRHVIFRLSRPRDFMGRSFSR